MKNIEDMYALSPLQEGLLFHTVAEPSSSAYHQQLVLKIDTYLDKQALENAWLNIIKRHSALRASFVWENLESPIQVIQQQIQAPITIEDWRQKNNTLDEDITSRIFDERKRPFSLLRAPLMRLLLIRVSDSQYYFIWTYHHLIIDGWSTNLLLSELLTSYSNLSNNEKLTLIDPQNYRRYVAWLQQLDTEKAKSYWQKQLEGWQHSTPLPLTGKNSSSINSKHDPKFSYGEQTLTFDENFSKQLHHFIRDQKTTLNTLAQAAWACLLQRHSGNDSVLFGATTHGRPPQLEGSDYMVGLFINTLPLKIDITPEQSAKGLLQQLQQQNSEMRQYDYISPAQIRQWCQAGNTKSLFESILVFENFPVDKALEQLSDSNKALTAILFDTNKPCHHGDNSVEGAIVHNGRNHFPLTLVWHPGEQPQIALSYQLNTYSHTTASELLQQYHCMLQEFMDKTEQPVTQLRLTQQTNYSGTNTNTAEENSNKRSEDYKIVDLVDLFQEQAKIHADQLAVIDNQSQLNYFELDARSNQLANYLLEQLPNHSSGKVIAICCDRSVALITGIIGTLKAGFAYLIIDPNLPTARIEMLLSDSSAQFLLSTSKELPLTNNELPQLLLDQTSILDLSSKVAPKFIKNAENLANLVYTSGSTGKPKGVMVPRRAISNYVTGFLSRHKSHLGDSMVNMATVTADLGNTQIFATLCSGKTLHLLDREHVNDPNAVAKYIVRHKVGSLKIVPSHLLGLLAADEPSQVLPRKTLILGGESTSSDLLQKISQLAPQLLIINHYGPSETTVGILTDVRHTEETNFPLGQPLANTRIYILDKDGQPVATGEYGELYVSGPALAQGYCNLPAQTAKAFIPDPFTNTGQRMYKTGDIVQQQIDGRLHYLGRSDSQVKIRGYRVEPLELENQMGMIYTDTQIKELAVAAHDCATSYGKRLVAYVVPTNMPEKSLPQSTENLISSLQQQLCAQLPDYLLPSVWIIQKELPRNANGKLDRKKLLPPDKNKETPDLGIKKVLPRNPIEQALSSIWQDVLNIKEPIGIQEDFFSLGGDSILNLQIIARANRLGIKLTPKQLFEHKTIAEIAAVADAQNSELSSTQADTIPLAQSQHYWLKQKNPQTFSHWRLLNCNNLSINKLEHATKQLLHHHPVLRSQFFCNDKEKWQHKNVAVEQAFAFTILQLDTNTDLQTSVNQWMEQYSFNDLQQPLLHWFPVISNENVVALLIQAHPLILDDSQWNDLIDQLHVFYLNPNNDSRVESVKFADWVTAHSPLSEENTELPIYNHTFFDNWSYESKSASEFKSQVIELADTHSLTSALTSQRLTWHHLITTACVQALSQWRNKEQVPMALVASSRPQTLVDSPAPDCYGDNRFSRVLGCFEQPLVQLWPRLSNDPLTALQQVKEHLYQQFRPSLLTTAKHSLVPIFLQISQPLNISTECFSETQRIVKQHQQDLTNTTALTIHVGITHDSLQVNWNYAVETINSVEINQLQELFSHSLIQLTQAILKASASRPMLCDFPLLSSIFKNNDTANLEKFNLNWPQIENIYPLSPMQEGMLLHTLLRPKTGIYLIQQHYHWKGKLNQHCLIQAWEMILQRYPVLRTGFYWKTEHRPIQVVYHNQNNPIEFFDWQDKSLEQQNMAMEAILAEERTQGFDMQHGPLTRLRVVQTGDSTYNIMRSFHHILADAWCFSLLMVDFITFYEALLEGHNIYLSPPRPYHDYIYWLESQDKKASENFWSDYLLGFSNPTPLAFKNLVATNESSHGINNKQLATLSREETQQLNKLAKQFHVTPNTFLQGAWIYLLSYYSGEKDILIGVTTSGRFADIEGIDNIFGLFINSLPLRTNVDHSVNLNTWLQILFKQNIKIRQYEYTSLVDIQRLSQITRGEELFQSLIVFENAPIATSLDRAHDSFNVDRGIDRVHTNYPITIVGYPGEELSVRISYDTQSFNATSVNRMLTHLMTLLRQMITDPGLHLSRLNPLSANEQQLLFKKWAPYKNHTSVNDTFINYFENQVTLHKNACAAKCGDSTLNYQQLNAKANRIANALLQRGVLPDQRIVICCDRNLDYLIMILAVLKSGAVFAPLDISHPLDRLQQILQQSSATFVLTADNTFDITKIAPAKTVLPLAQLLAHPNDDNPKVFIHQQQLAYVIYTSGSTGSPKGVMVHHSGMLNNILNKKLALSIDQNDIIAQTAPPCFDISVWQFLAALAFGAQVDILPDDISKDPYRLADAVEKKRITLLEIVPALLPGLIEAQKDFSQLRWLLSIGEALPVIPCEQWFNNYPQIPVMNAYGPAECSDNVAHYPLHSAPAQTGGTVAIGHPTNNNQLYIINSLQQISPIGVVGEIAIAGKSVGRGYLDNPRHTAISFIPNPWSESGERLYLSGDLGRWSNNTVLEYLGRGDQQVKIRGHRIELGEIEAVLELLPNVSRAVILSATDTRGDQQLLGYVESAHENAEQLKRQLAKRLPAYMVPQSIATLDTLPLNTNGKVDRNALSALNQTLLPQELNNNTYVAPVTELEQHLAVIWQEILHCKNVGRTDNFFQLGGHSLLATQVLARIRQQLDIELPLKVVFENTTVLTLADAIETVQANSTNNYTQIDIPRISRKQPLPLSFAQQRLWFLNQLEGNSTVYNMPTTIKLSGQLDIDALETAINTLVARHESLRTYYGIDGDLPRQYIDQNCQVKVCINDISMLNDSDQTQTAQRLIATEASLGFNLSKSPMLRVALLHLAEKSHILQFTLHHIAADAWSMGVLIDEFIHCYQAYVANRTPSLAPLPIQYVDYAHWQRSESQVQQQVRDINYWRQQLKGVQTLCKLPLDFERSSQADYRGTSFTQIISAKHSSKLKSYGQKHQATLFMVMLNAFNCVMQRFTGEDDFIVGTDIANREHYALEGLVGFFVNILPLRAQFGNNDGFKKQLDNLRDTALNAFQHQQVPFDKLVEELQPDRVPGINPLVQVLFVMQNTPTMNVTLDHLNIEVLNNQYETCKFDIAVFVEENEDGSISTRWLYRSCLFKTKTVKNLADGFHLLLEHVIEIPSLQLSQWDWQTHTSKPVENIQEKTLRKITRKKAKLGKLKQAKPKAINNSPQEQINTSLLEYTDADNTLPLIIKPRWPELDPVNWALQSRQWINEKLKKHGGLLFRDFNLPNTVEFEKFAKAIEPDLYGNYGDLPKNKSGQNIYHSTPYPEQQMILYHNESSHMAKWPRKQWFYCETPALEGGCTPIVDCRKVYQRLPADIIKNFEHKGLLYVRHFTNKLDVKWQEFFKTQDRHQVEQQCVKTGIKWEWYSDEHQKHKNHENLRIEQHCPAIIRHPDTNEKSFFNQVQLHHESCLATETRTNLHSLFGANNLPRNVYYGDGSVIEDTVMEIIGNTYESCAIRFDWQKGDVIMLDNMLVAHARDPYVGERKICVAMGQMCVRDEELASIC